MLCPTCGHDNLPGAEECAHCHQALTTLDAPAPNDIVEKSLMEDTIAVLHPGEPITVKPSATLGVCIDIMLSKEIGALVVVDDDGKLAGILTERDLLTKVAGIQESYANMLVSEIMTTTPETVTCTATLNFALHKMDVGGYRHLPVLDADNRPIGVISVRDMIAHITRLCQNL